MNKQEATVIKSREEIYNGDIVIPSSFFFEGITYTVTQIGDSAFEYCECLTSVDIPENTLTIGNSALSGCKGLVSVTGGEKVRYIGNNVFNNCKRLEIFEIKDSLEVIGNEAFAYCECLSMEIPPKLQTLGARAFMRSWLLAIICIIYHQLSSQKAYCVLMIMLLKIVIGYVQLRFLVP